MDKDIYYIKETFKLARKAEGFTSPNPLVGSIIVKNNRVVARGYHKRAGLPHAEIEAIKKANISLKGATIYISLEPCCHFGRTPPCVEAIIASGIKRVVFSIVDPNPQVSGKSINRLKQAGIKVEFGICEREAEKLNEVFFTSVRKKRPFIAVKTAQSLDGKTATAKGVSKWITSDHSRQYARALRDKYDAVLVGVNTVIKDNPVLNGLEKIPFKVVIDPDLRTSASCSLVKNNPAKLIIFTSVKNRKKAQKFPPAVNLFFLEGEKTKFSLKSILRKLYKAGITSLFVEGGADTAGRFFDAKLVDKVYFFIAPKVIGGKNALSSIGGKGFPTPAKGPYFREKEIIDLGEDFIFIGYPCYR